MAEKTSPTEPTASSLKKELSESLELLTKDFAGLKNFVAEIAPEGMPASIPLSKDELHDLLTATEEIYDAANDMGVTRTSRICKLPILTGGLARILAQLRPARGN